ncbi:MAG: T9SS type A sorting domain-containing protein [Saprospiraceae bacterium]
MKIAYFLILNIVWIGFCQAQSNTFFKTYSTSNSVGNSVVCTHDNGYAFLGSTYEIYNNSNLYLVKTDEFGDTLWTKIYNMPYLDVGFSIQETYDNGFVLAGQVGEPDTISIGASDIYMLKTDEFGDTIWTFTTNLGIGDKAYSIRQLIDSSYVVTGVANESVNSTNKNSFLLKLDKNGQLLWQHIYENYSSGKSVIQTLDNGFIVCGQYGLFNNTAVYLIKTNSLGDTIWTKKGGLGFQYGRGEDVVQLFDSSYIVTGSVYNNSNQDVFVSKIDKNGNLIWTKQYGGNEDDYANAIHLVEDNGFIIAGDTYSYSVGQFYNADIWLLRFDENGDTLWSKSYGNTENNQATDVKSCPDKGFIVTGSSGTTPNAFLLKIDSLGNSPIISSTSIIQEKKGLEFNIYPNPTSEIITVEFNASLGYSDVVFTIHDYWGRQVKQFKEKKDDNIFQFDVSSLEKGIYYLTISHDNKILMTKHFLKQ